ncbi:IS701 family transposase [Streptosporangium fragile]|uniref:IS701 family transposase n=1 Tax=Streptosporangium fragile TaxID=46186 RepID=A0ABP6IU54_9ACTN
MTFPLTYDLVMSWDADLQALTDRLAAPLFSRPEPRASFGDLVRALLSDVPRKNSWQLSDHIGHATANRFEHLLARAKWDLDRLRDEVRRYVVDHLAHPDAVLIADDTAAIKRGDMSAGVARQYCGRTGQVENCQVMPMLTYASAAGHTFINRRLYLPETWTSEPARRARAHIPNQVTFATKPQLVIAMLEEELADGTPFRYLCADSGYGRDPQLRAFCHQRAIAYVMAVPVDLPLVALYSGGEPAGHVLDRLLAHAGPGLWKRRSCGQGSKGARLYDWCATRVHLDGQEPAPGHVHTLLIRRSVSSPGDIELFLAHAIRGTTISTLISAAGMRWKIEENNEHGKDLLGLTEYQVRTWEGWHRHVTAVMLALAFLTVTRSRLPDDDAPGQRDDQGKDQAHRTAPPAPASS